jgi:T5SS/PEP-CTERM-associated repeat protein
VSVLGGSTLSTRASYLSYNPNSTGSVLVSGTNSKWLSSEIFLGFDGGSGTLTVSDGGFVSSDYGGLLAYFTGSTGSALITGTGSQWNAGLLGGGLQVGVGGSGTLTISAGGVASASVGVLGGGIGSTGSAAVTGAGSQWNMSQGLTVGNRGSGTLTISSGGVVNSAVGALAYDPGSTGSALVTGTGSQWNLSSTLGGLMVGGQGNATLTISAGGVVNSAGGGQLGDGGTGSALITGAGSHWNITNSGLLLGLGGSGTMTISDGGAMTITNNDSPAFGIDYKSYMGLLATSTGSMFVTGTGSQWNLTKSDLSIGYSGSGTLMVADGGVVNSTNAIVLAGNAGSTGSVLVTGIGSQVNLTTSALDVGVNGSGTLTISAGGVINSATGSLGIGDNSSGIVLVTGTGSRWNIGQNLYAGGSSLGPGGSGALTVASGGTVNVGGSVTVFAGSQINVTSDGTFSASSLLAPGELTNNGQVNANVTIATGGTLAGTGTIAGSLTMVAGSHYAPGNSPGMQTVNGDVTWNSLTYSMEIAAVTGAQGVGYDSLDIYAAGPATHMLTITNGATIDIDLSSYPSNSTVADFDYLTPFDLILVSTDGGVAGFGNAIFNVHPSAFASQNPLNGGVFSVLLSGNGNDILLHYAAVPEPGTLLLALTAAGPLVWRVRRRKVS